MIESFLFKRHLEDDEHVSEIIHKHWLIGLKFLFWPSVSFLLSLSALIAVYEIRALVFLTALWSIGSLVWWLRSFFDYYLDAWIITDHGIIDLEWHGWFRRQSARVLYSDIQGVSYEIQGVSGTLLRYGTVAVEKISTGSVISMTHVSQPRVVESLILKNMEGYLHGKNLKDARHVKELLAEFVANQVQMEGRVIEEELVEATAERKKKVSKKK
ncbi:PH domain-containing protein [Candidatus Peregrinibacteria bacterium]|nr:PH domain-containing protein [Candidatus Peregrinibacteria bacterium]